MTPEGLVKKEIVLELEKLDAYIFKPVQTGFGERTVDILCCVKGRFVAIECKRADGSGKLTAHQAKVLGRVMDAGGLGIVARGWEDVYNVLKEEYVI